MNSSHWTIGKPYFFVREGSRHYRIDFARIRYIEARKSYCRIDTAEKIHMAAIGISQLEEIFPPDDFCRIHRSYIVGIAHIDWFENSLIRVAGKDLPIGDAHRAPLRRKLMLVPGESLKTLGPAAEKSLVLLG